jgi:hypothetical protein
MTTIVCVPAAPAAAVSGKLAVWPGLTVAFGLGVEALASTNARAIVTGLVKPPTALTVMPRFVAAPPGVSTGGFALGKTALAGLMLKLKDAEPITTLTMANATGELLILAQTLTNSGVPTTAEELALIVKETGLPPTAICAEPGLILNCGGKPGKVKLTAPVKLCEELTETVMGADPPGAIARGPAWVDGDTLICKLGVTNSTKGQDCEMLPELAVKVACT